MFKLFAVLVLTGLLILGQLGPVFADDVPRTKLKVVKKIERKSDNYPIASIVCLEGYLWVFMFDNQLTQMLERNPNVGGIAVPIKCDKE